MLCSYHRIIMIMIALVCRQVQVRGFRPLLTTSSNRKAISSCLYEKEFMRHSVVEILQSALGRASSTLANNNQDQFASKVGDDNAEITTTNVNGLIRSAITRGNATISNRKQAKECDEASSRINESVELKSKNQIQSSITDPRNSNFKYKENPAFQGTALAQTLWSYILRPNVDTAIDATCGNGNDSVAIAQMLFSATPTNDYSDASSSPTASSIAADIKENKSQLICVDIQDLACKNTTEALAKLLHPYTMKNNVQILHTSHASLLPIVKRKNNDFSHSVGLIVYNLGFLPRSDKACATQLESTVLSLIDAFLIVRIGGMISVMTYPKTNPVEDVAVRVLFECVALLSSNVTTWKKFLENTNMDDIDDDIKPLIAAAMEKVIELGDIEQTWRVSEHKRLGMDRAPILLTATRIK